MPNPKRKALQQQVRACRQGIEALEAQLGRAVEGNEERRRPTVRGLKAAHARLRREIAQQRQSWPGWKTACAIPPAAFPPPRWIAPALCSAKTAA